MKQVSPAYRGALGLVATQQILLGILAGMVLDGGALGFLYLYALVAFWAGFFMMLVRRPRNPTRTDVFFIKWGTFMLFLISIVMAPVIWKIRGAM